MRTDPTLAKAAYAEARGAGRWRRARCPYCPGRKGSADRHGAFGVDTQTGFFHCFRCHIKGRIPGIGGAVDDYVHEVVHEFEPPDGFEELAPIVGTFDASRAEAYLSDRGVDFTTVKEARIGQVMQSKDRIMEGRIVVPLLAKDGRTWKGWSARLFVKPGSFWKHPPPKYKYPKGMDRAHIVFNEAALSAHTNRPVLLVEGVFDALPYWPDAVACMGKPSPHQIPSLATKRPLVVALDGDAWREGEAFAWRLKLDGFNAHAVRLPPGEDPGSVGPAWLFAEAKRVSGL